jgi:hypothetical protein
MSIGVWLQLDNAATDGDGHRLRPAPLRIAIIASMPLISGSRKLISVTSDDASGAC